MGAAGNDIITGGSGNDTLVGGIADDTITAGTGNDSISGGLGNDTVTIAGNLTAADTLAGGEGTADILSIGTAAATLATAANVSGFVTLAVTTAGLTTDLSVYATNNTITRLNEVGAAGAYTVTGASAEFTTLAAGTAGDTFTFSRALNTARIQTRGSAAGGRWPEHCSGGTHSRSGRPDAVQLDQGSTPGPAQWG